jgi:Kef-type K+ transport system membrane component KefB
MKNLFRGAMIVGFLLVVSSSFLTETAHESETVNIAGTFFALAAILLLAKVGSSLAERLGQPGVLGELLVGLVLGNLYLCGWNVFEPLWHNVNLSFLAELGVVILLFQIGLEANVSEMLKVGLRAFLVATVGVVVPFVIGTWVVGPWCLPGLPFTTYLFLGAALTATSVGITARVFQDLGRAGTKEARIVLGAAVIDDVMGLVVLAVASAIVTAGSVSGLTIVWIVIKATVFLLGAIVIGQMLAPVLSKGLSRINSGVGMKFTLAITFALVFSYLSQRIGLAPIVGAFAAGLVLDPVHFRYFAKPDISRRLKGILKRSDSQFTEEIGEAADEHADQHVERLIKPVGLLLVPVFFVLTGAGVKLETLFDTSIIMTALAVTIAAFIGKIVAGMVAGKGVNKWVVGWGMVPRGEVGLIFAVTGKGLGVMDDSVYSIVVIMVALSTLLVPPILATLLKRQKA